MQSNGKVRKETSLLSDWNGVVKDDICNVYLLILIPRGNAIIYKSNKLKLRFFSCLFTQCRTFWPNKIFRVTELALTLNGQDSPNIMQYLFNPLPGSDRALLWCTLCSPIKLYSFCNTVNYMPLPSCNLCCHCPGHYFIFHFCKK